MAKFNIKFVVKILSILITNISPELKQSIKDGLDKLEAKAKTTVNPFDDLAVSLLRAIFD